jgi:hypothetical protein
MAHENLTPLRGPNVWDKPGFGARESRETVERMLVGGAGLLLLVLGLQGRSVGRRATAAAGASLLALAGTVGGLDRARAWTERQRWRWRHRDSVTDQSAQSFPASDSPAWTATTASGAAQRDEPTD